VSAVIAQHIYSMQLSYPEVFAAKKTTDATDIPGLDCGNRMVWFWTRCTSISPPARPPFSRSTRSTRQGGSGQRPDRH
jgi:hypothetical protein